MPGTRETVLFELISWVTSGLIKIFWLAGMAGTGKTSIAVTLCRMLQNDSSVTLGGSFFCSRTTGSVARTEVRRILPTLVVSLAAQVPEFAVVLAAELKTEDRVAHKPASDQIMTLLRKPLDALSLSSRPIVFVIDALDECSDARELAELLAAIADFEHNTNIKFILTSRPEMHIRGTPISNHNHNTILQLHTISEEEVSADIRRYISETLRDIPSIADWYTIDDVDTLVRLSNGLFIFASTALKYVLSREQVKGRKTRLQKVTCTASGSLVATSSLDKIYEMIVQEASRPDRVDEDELRITQQVIACILAARTSLSVQALADLLEFETEDLRGSLENLHSVVYVPAEDTVACVRVLHASFGDYIVSRAAKDVRIDASLGDCTLARGCLHVMAKHLHFNISQSCSSYQPNSATRPDCIMLSVEYACLQWIYHVSRLPDPSVLDNEIKKIFRPRFLFWLEVASVLGRIQRASAMLHIATSTVRLPELSHFLRDARAFVASSHEAIEKSAPHIYLSALPFASKHSLIYKTFAPLCTGIISVETFGIDRHGGRRLITLGGHKGRVNSVAYSADSHLLVSGGEDGTARIWDTRTGEETMPPLHSENGRVTSVAFASSGRVIASGNSGPRSRGTSVFSVCIWNIGTKHVVPQRLLGHSDTVCSLAFSPDDSILASASWDFTVRLWRPETGESIAVLDGHTYLKAVAFSPNGLMLAAGFEDNIQLWEVAPSKPVGESLRGLQNPTSGPFRDGITCLSFSPDGTKIAAGSFHKVELWEPLTWRSIATLDGYRGMVSSVQFSPDGKYLMTAEDNETICLRNLQQDAVMVLSKCSDRYKLWGSHPATFSPDGLQIASGSAGGMIQILDVGDNQVTVQALEAHERRVTSVAVSPNGAIIVSGSAGGVVRVWNAQTGEPTLPPLLGHKAPVKSVAFSLGGRWIESISTIADHSVRVWDAQTGEAVCDPLPWQYQPTNGSVTASVFSSEARLFATGYKCEIAKTANDRALLPSPHSPRYEGSVHVFEVSTGNPLTISPLHCESPVQGIAFSWDDAMLAAVTKDGWIHLWRLSTGRQVWKPLHQVRARTGLSFNAWKTEARRSTDVLMCIGFPPDASHVVSGGSGRICFWDVNTCQLVLELKYPGFANSVAFSPCGRYIASGTNSTSDANDFTPGPEHGTVRLWDASTGTPVATMRGHGRRVHSVAYSPDGQSIITCSKDSTIRVWDVAAARSLSSADPYDPIAVLSSVDLDKGWVLGPKKELLLWVPEEYRHFIQAHPCTLLIGRHRVFITGDGDGLHAGENWTACWRRNAPGL